VKSKIQADPVNAHGSSMLAAKDRETWADRPARFGAAGAGPAAGSPLPASPPAARGAHPLSAVYSGGGPRTGGSPYASVRAVFAAHRGAAATPAKRGNGRTAASSPAALHRTGGGHAHQPGLRDQYCFWFSGLFNPATSATLFLVKASRSGSYVGQESSSTRRADGGHRADRA